VTRAPRAHQHAYKKAALPNLGGSTAFCIFMRYKRLLLSSCIAALILLGLMAGLHGVPVLASVVRQVLGEFDGTWNYDAENYDSLTVTAADTDAYIEGDWSSGSGKLRGFSLGWNFIGSDFPISMTICAKRSGPDWDGETDQGTSWEPGNDAFELRSVGWAGEYWCRTFNVEGSFDEIVPDHGLNELHCDGDPPATCSWDLYIDFDQCEPVTDVDINLIDGYQDYDTSVITAVAGTPLEFDLDYSPVDATEPVTEFVEALGGMEGFVPGSPEGHWEAGWATPGTYSLTYAVANCDGTGDLGDTSVPCYEGHQWEQVTVEVITQCIPLEGIWLNGEQGGEFYAELGEIWGGQITYLPAGATQDSIRYPGEFDRGIWASGDPPSIATSSGSGFTRYDDLNFSFRPDITGTLYITYALANCEEEAGWGSEPYPGYQWGTATLHITDTVPITWLIPITQPTASTMDCTYCLRPSEVCTESTSICVVTSWIEWQTCLQRCWFDFGLDWSLYIFELFQWWDVQIMNWAWSWPWYWWNSAQLQYQEFYSKWLQLQDFIMAYYRTYADFVQSLSLWINLSVANIAGSFSNIYSYLQGKIAQLVPFLSSWANQMSDYLDLIRLVIEYRAANGFKRVKLAWQIVKRVRGLINWKIISPLGRAISIIQRVVDLASKLAAGARRAIGSDTKADLFNYGVNFSDPSAQQIGGMEAMGAEGEGGLSYALEGLEFFEDLAGASPLNYASYISIGILALRLSMWTLAKARDLMEDLRHF